MGVENISPRSGYAVSEAVTAQPLGSGVALLWLSATYTSGGSGEKAICKDVHLHSKYLCRISRRTSEFRFETIEPYFDLNLCV